jgi:ABC-type transport system involved in multi-copper enzyme maturation permease subunit
MELSNPILIKEMRTRMRGRRAFLELTGDDFALSMIIGLIYIVFTNNVPPAMLNQAGIVLTPVLLYVQMGLICLMAPTFAAGAISSEREQQTFDLLVSSLARPLTILTGKIGASLSYLLLTLFGSLPLIALTYSLGGVALIDIAKAYLVLLVAGITYCSLSFMWSSLIRRGVLAQLASITTVVFLVAALPALSLFFTALANNFNGAPSRTFINILFLMLRTNPFAAIAFLLHGFPRPQGIWLDSVPIWVTQVLFYLCLTALSLYLSYKRLKRVRNWL